MSLTAINRRRDLALYEIATGKLTRIGDGSGIDANPAWSSDGKYLYFISSRHENPVGSDVDFDFAILKSAGIYAIPLARDTASPRRTEVRRGQRRLYDSSSAQPDEAKHEQETKPGKHDDQKKKDDSAAEPAEPIKLGPIKPIRIDLDGLMARAVAVPVDAANIAQLDVRGDRIFYLTQPLGLIDGMLAGEKSELRFYDLKTRKSSLVTEDVDGYSLVARRATRADPAREGLHRARDQSRRGQGHGDQEAAQARSFARAGRSQDRSGRRCSRMPGGSSATSSTRRP